ncbi:protein DBF4 homolog A [Galendromus occidentalis]|uniref:Protein DBF4 homolog A n=1 Tax=Galendromus occidentalis TaxID=34638 RepID=A0AAJ6QYM0_9ACAR|nr:protein DBF4 homolog A [Galendromus occidentalis]
MPAVAKRSAPLRGKLVFLDTKAPVLKLREQLEVLGARVETFFSKDIWCVITDKQVDEANKRLLSLAATSTKQRTPFLNRTQVLLQAAQQKEARKKADESQTVVQECKQWDIPMLSIRTASTSVSKLMKKYQPANEPSSLKRSSTSNTLRKVVSESHLGKSTRLEGHEILKIEDRRQQYKPLYKIFKEDTYPRVRVMQTPSGRGVLISPFAEEKDQIAQRESLSESRRNRVDTAKATTTVDSRQKSRKRNAESKQAESKSKYCEICHEYFSNLRSHLSSPGHVRASSDSSRDLQKFIGEFQNDFLENSDSLTGGSPKNTRTVLRLEVSPSVEV